MGNVQGSPDAFQNYVADELFLLDDESTFSSDQDDSPDLGDDDDESSDSDSGNSTDNEEKTQTVLSKPKPK